MKDLNYYFEEGLIVEDNSVINLSNKYLEKARNNIITMNILSRIDRCNDVLNIPEDYDKYEWIIIAAYYAMYMAALALIARKGLRSKNHMATILAVKEFFVKENYMSEEEFNKLINAKKKREIAQYDITKKTNEKLAKEIIKEAMTFVNKVEEVLIDLK